MADNNKSPLNNKSLLDYAMPVAGVATGVANSLMNFQSQRENRDMQIDLMREQNKFQEHMYERQLHDNSPIAQVHKLSVAGLNPALSFSDAQGVSTPSVGSPPTISAPEQNFSDSVLNGASIIQSLSAAQKDSEEAKGYSFDNQYKNEYWWQYLSKMKAEADKLKADKNLSEADRNKVDAESVLIDWQRRLLVDSFGAQKEGFTLQNLLNQAKTEMVRSQMRSYDADAAYKESLNELNKIDVQFAPSKLRATISSILAEAGANSSLAKKYDSEKAVADEVKHKTGLESKQIEKILPFIVPRVRAEIYRNSLGNSNFKLGFLGVGGSRSAYEMMFDDLTPSQKYSKHNTRGQHRALDDMYGNTD